MPLVDVQESARNAGRDCLAGGRDDAGRPSDRNTIAMASAPAKTATCVLARDAAFLLQQVARHAGRRRPLRSRLTPITRPGR
ncbi:hypothetical protein Dda_1909 [Drechslerella dactyloides]|uniref:Uncharacterized protein n=1 Tax=Drechslerella dactyloides TaxID=74499 RepID=A0AAD6J3E6_DREDA|nr:hypothetical protein Dda_1909 [Drechslerella dactyloides]